MGCCGEKNNKFSTMEFFVDLFILEPNNGQKSCFIIKKIESQKFEKVIEKTLKEHLADSKILNNKILGEKFQFNINNSLFYCYTNENPIVKNFLQIKDLEPFNFESLYKISILLTKNYDKLSLPKINLINKTKFSSDLNNLNLDFSNVEIDNQKIFDPNLTCDNFILTKPNLTENLSENEGNNNDNENDDMDVNNGQNNESDDNDSEFNSLDEGDEENNINGNNAENENIKNYIHITGEINANTVKDVFMKLSKYKKVDDEYDNNYELNPKGRKSKGSIYNEDDFFKQKKSGISIVDENILSKRGKEMYRIDEQEKFESSIDSDIENKNKEKNDENKINDKNVIDSVFIEEVKMFDLELFSELIDILTTYPYLKRISFSDFHIEKDFDGWENILHLINENSNIRWMDFHKSNINNSILESICSIIENKRIRYLDISENFINQEGAKTIGFFLSKNKTLQRLILNNNDLEDFKKEGIHSICEPLISHPNIELLDFSSMTVTGCGEYVANLIKSSKTLKVIILRDCSLNLKDFQNICRALSSPNISKTIINVDLSHNDMASDKSIEEIGKMIKVNKSLTTLNMEKMNLTMQTYNFILNGLNENDTIINFSFCYNPKVKPKIILEYFLHRKKLNTFAYIPYKSSINDKGPKVEFTLEEKKIIEKFKKKRKKVKLITR